MNDDTAIPAAAIIVLRDSPAGPEVLMVERASSLAFAGGALVFPGGRVDPGDRAIAARIGGDPEETAYRIAAIREMIEETGLAIGADPELLAHRTALLAGQAFPEELSVNAFDPASLVPFAHWLPAGMPHRIFDTRFYLARMPVDIGEAVVDGSENVHAFWSRPVDTLAIPEAGGARIIFPTRRILERLAAQADVAAVLADALARPMPTITPWVEDRDGVPHLCIPEGLGYPVTAEPMTTAART